MKTVKEVSKLTGISVRTLQYYDRIGLLKPTEKNAVGYRFYDEEAIAKLQQILFFKELDFKLKDIKDIMNNPKFDKIKAYTQQKDLLKSKIERMNRLIKLLERLEKGESYMEFKEFDLSEYFEVLEKFKRSNAEEVVEEWGSLEAFDNVVKQMKENENRIAKNAIKYYGSVERYTEQIKENLSHFKEKMGKIKALKEKDYLEKTKELNNQLLADITKDPKSEEVQAIIQKVIILTNEVNKLMDMTLPEKYWELLIEKYLYDKSLIQEIDKRYGNGASVFIGKAYQYYFSDK